MSAKKTLCTMSATLLLAMAAPASHAALIDGLVEYWEMDGNFSANIVAAHAGTLTTNGAGSGTFAAGKFGQAIDLENSTGNQAFVVIGGNENDFDFAGGSMSASAWYTTESLYVNFQALMGKGENASWRIARNSGSGTSFKLSVSGAIGDGELDQQNGSFHHVVAIYDGANGTKLFVDGVLVGSTAAAYVLPNIGNAMQIGGNPQAAGRGWDGMIDDVAIWNRALTTQEIESIFNRGQGASIRSLIAPAVPEPATASMALVALGGLMLRRRSTR